MVVDVAYAVECMLLLNSHKWYVDIRYLAHVLMMSCEELQETVDALKTAGEGQERQERVDQVDRSYQIRSRQAQTTSTTLRFPLW